ncbi:hypothetical protein [Sphingomonas swuensis]|uniref:hypothetical protein n=1 Tax=Sphingomonas swuensis TaxID=977800 RepID=UPI0031DE9E3B
MSLLAGCGQRDETSKRPSEDLRTYDVAEEPAPPPPMAPPPPLVRAEQGQASADGAGPNIGVSAAPGVAFNYRYAYRLANARIQAAQEAHAQMCEKLTIARCRITGMRYSLVNERDISASLEIKLDPAIARQFGKDATRVVTDAEGMLVDQQISGVDMAPTIEGANRGRAALQDDLERVTRELARPGLSSVVRDRLLSEANQLRAQIRSLGEQRQAAEDSLATTPMSFFYGSGATVPGFDDERPIASAIERAGENFQAAIGFLIVAFATLLPWALLVGLLVWLWRRLGVGTWLMRRSDEAFERQA